MKPGGLLRAGVAEHEVDEGEGRTPTPSDVVSHPETRRSQRAGKLDRLLVSALDQDLVTAEWFRDAMRRAAEEYGAQ